MNTFDPIALCSKNYLDKCMNLRPTVADHMWYIIQGLYLADKTKFDIYSTPHQNDEKDLFHMSVEYRDRYYTIRLHLNGYYKNDFIFTSVDYVMNNNKVWSEPREIARFEKK